MLSKAKTPSTKQAEKYRKNHRFQMKSMVFGGDKRDRTADLLNAIDGRGSVRQGQALQKEKTLKCKGFFSFARFAHFTFLLHVRLNF